MKLALLFGGRRWAATLLVLAAMVVLIRLGFWQIDRLEQRRARNAEAAAQMALPPLALGTEPVPDDPAAIRYRRGTATGRFDLDRQVALKVQNFDGTAGIHLVAPLVLDGPAAGGRAVLVDRGWIPDELSDPAQWAQFDETGPVSVVGFLRPSETVPARRNGTAAAAPAAASPQRAWYRVDIGALERQMPYELLPVYVLQSPGPAGNTQLPYRVDPQFDLSEGSHLGYALQWWTFAGLAGIIYVVYIGKQEARAARTSESTDVEQT